MEFPTHPKADAIEAGNAVRKDTGALCKNNALFTGSNV